VSSFDLALPDWDFTSEKHEYEAPPRYTERQVATKVTEEELQAEANRRTGDVAIYRYYVGSVGWIPTLIFIVSITIFIFGISFPCKSCKNNFKATTNSPSQQFGSSFGRSTTKSILISVLISILAFTQSSAPQLSSS
jgi:hypothetical protein